MSSFKLFNKKNEKLLFFKRVLRNPRSFGAVMPSSKALGKLVCNHLMLDPESYVVEVGAGTGSLTRCLLEHNVDPKRLIIVELDAELCGFLKTTFPDITIIQGDALQLDSFLHPDILGNVSTIISGIPLINLSKSEQNFLFKAFQKVLAKNGRILQFTYGFLSPLAHKRFGLFAKRLGVVFKNVPPAALWCYTFIHHQKEMQIPYTVNTLQP